MNKLNLNYLDFLPSGFLILSLALIRLLTKDYHDFDLLYFIAALFLIVSFIYAFAGRFKKFRINYYVLAVKLLIIYGLTYYCFMISPKYTDGISQYFITVFFIISFVIAMIFIILGHWIGERINKNKNAT